MISVMPVELKNDVGIKEFHSDKKNIDFKDFGKKANGSVKSIGVSSNVVLASTNFPLIKKLSFIALISYIFSYVSIDSAADSYITVHFHLPQMPKCLRIRNRRTQVENQ